MSEMIPAVLYRHDAFCHLCKMVVMRDEDDGGSLLIECSQLAHNLRPEAESRLPVGSSAMMIGGFAATARDRNTLLLSAGHLTGR